MGEIKHRDGEGKTGTQVWRYFAKSLGSNGTERRSFSSETPIKRADAPFQSRVSAVSKAALVIQEFEIKY